MQSTCVGLPLRIDGEEKVYHHHAAHVAELVVAEKLGQSTAVRFTDITKKVLGIYDSIQSFINFFVLIPVRV